MLGQWQHAAIFSSCVMENIRMVPPTPLPLVEPSFCLVLKGYHRIVVNCRVSNYQNGRHKLDSCMCTMGARGGKVGQLYVHHRSTWG